MNKRMTGFGVLMKRVVASVAIAVGAMTLTGCFAPSPYAYRDNWAFRQNAVPQYFSDFDAFYIHTKQVGETDWMEKAKAVEMYDIVKHTIQEPLGKKVRVFAPCVRESHAVEDAVAALDYYLDTYHDKGRFFVVLVDGRDSAFVEQFQEQASGLLKTGNGFIGSMSRDKLCLDHEATTSLWSAVRRRRMRSTWHVKSVPEVF